MPRKRKEARVGLERLQRRARVGARGRKSESRANRARAHRGVGVIGGVVAFSEHGIADGICKGNSCAQSAIDHESTANGAAWVANIGFVTGAILAATAVVVYVLDGKRRRQIAFTF